MLTRLVQSQLGVEAQPNQSRDLLFLQTEYMRRALTLAGDVISAPAVGPEDAAAPPLAILAGYRSEAGADIEEECQYQLTVLHIMVMRPFGNKVVKIYEGQEAAMKLLVPVIVQRLEIWNARPGARSS